LNIATSSLSIGFDVIPLKTLRDLFCELRTAHNIRSIFRHILLIIFVGVKEVQQHDSRVPPWKKGVATPGDLAGSKLALSFCITCIN
jgi:hypothetical protein